MNKNVKKLVKRAGFALWGNEDWNPGDVVDWSSRYDNQLVKYTYLLVKEVLELQAAGTDVKKHFGVE